MLKFKDWYILGKNSKKIYPEKTNTKENIDKTIDIKHKNLLNLIFEYNKKIEN